MIGSILLVLAGATHDAVMANYEAGFRGAAQHRGHGWTFHPDTREWLPPTGEPSNNQELDAALTDRRPALLEWLVTFNIEEYLLSAGMTEVKIERLRTLLAG